MQIETPYKYKTNIYKIILIIRIEVYRILNTDMLQLTKVYKQNKIIYKWVSISYDDMTILKPKFKTE